MSVIKGSAVLEYKSVQCECKLCEFNVDVLLQLADLKTLIKLWFSFKLSTNLVRCHFEEGIFSGVMEVSCTIKFQSYNVVQI